MSVSQHNTPTEETLFLLFFFGGTFGWGKKFFFFPSPLSLHVARVKQQFSKIIDKFFISSIQMFPQVSFRNESQKNSIRIQVCCLFDEHALARLKHVRPKEEVTVPATGGAVFLKVYVTGDKNPIWTGAVPTRDKINIDPDTRTVSHRGHILPVVPARETYRKSKSPSRSNWFMVCFLFIVVAITILFALMMAH